MARLAPFAVVLAVAASFGFLLLASPLSPRPGTGGLAYLSAFFPPDLSPAFLADLRRRALETLAIAGLATLWAVLAGLVLALGIRGLRAGSALLRLALGLLRAIPELVWAALIVLITGLGPFAGLLALAVHTTGVLGRLFAEVLENAPRAPAEALRRTGAGVLAAFFYGTFPAVAPQLLVFALYRFEYNLRMAMIMGFVGAGGIGQVLHESLSLFQQPRAMTVIAVMLALVFVTDLASGALRRRL